MKADGRKRENTILLLPKVGVLRTIIKLLLLLLSLAGTFARDDYLCRSANPLLDKGETLESMKSMSTSAHPFRRTVSSYLKRKREEGAKNKEAKEGEAKEGVR